MYSDGEGNLRGKPLSSPSRPELFHQIIEPANEESFSNENHRKWYEIDSRADVVFDQRFQTKVFEIPSSHRSKQYREYRLRILATRKLDCDMCQMSKFELLQFDDSLAPMDEIIANGENAPAETTQNFMGNTS